MQEEFVWNLLIKIASPRLSSRTRCCCTFCWNFLIKIHKIIETWNTANKSKFISSSNIYLKRSLLLGIMQFFYGTKHSTVFKMSNIWVYLIKRDSCVKFTTLFVNNTVINRRGIWYEDTKLTHTSKTQHLLEKVEISGQKRGWFIKC